ncbi:LysR family transcriptional regulator [Variovorax sp. N23]|uniref:LysR family transcriptional regulator n=1 Tax=Variovorax sp. N23 TaxID=2980555 RepID=UPI0021C59B60|nr:LysR substrate-binding domain-containing protein [Variovorax sp. N23]MCU4119049.1 LysR substrate-binding domain-containing protein [Variovorax sp. N23]
MTSMPSTKIALASPVRTRIIEHDLLRVFVAVVDYGGFTAAATILHRTQAAVSLQIKRLEETVQVALFQHPRRAVQLTPRGELLLEYARRMISLNDEALSAIRGDEVTGRVRIGAINNYASGILPPLLAEFCTIYPEVQIEVHTGVAADMEKKLGSIYDLTINLHTPGTGTGVLISQQEPIWVTSLHNSPDRRDPLPLALLPNGSLFRRYALQALAQQGRAWHLAHESTNIAAVEAATAAGLAITVFQRKSVDFNRLRELTEAEGFPKLPGADVRLEIAERFLPQAAVQLRAFLLEKFAQRVNSAEDSS